MFILHETQLSYVSTANGYRWVRALMDNKNILRNYTPDMEEEELT